MMKKFFASFGIGCILLFMVGCTQPAATSPTVAPSIPYWIDVFDDTDELFFIIHAPIAETSPETIADVINADLGLLEQDFRKYCNSENIKKTIYILRIGERQDFDDSVMLIVPGPTIDGYVGHVHKWCSSSDPITDYTSPLLYGVLGPHNFIEQMQWLEKFYPQLLPYFTKFQATATAEMLQKSAYP